MTALEVFIVNSTIQCKFDLMPNPAPKKQFYTAFWLILVGLGIATDFPNPEIIRLIRYWFDLTSFSIQFNWIDYWFGYGYLSYNKIFCQDM